MLSMAPVREPHLAHFAECASRLTSATPYTRPLLGPVLAPQVPGTDDQDLLSLTPDGLSTRKTLPAILAGRRQLGQLPRVPEDPEQRSLTLQAPAARVRAPRYGPIALVGIQIDEFAGQPSHREGAGVGFPGFSFGRTPSATLLFLGGDRTRIQCVLQVRLSARQERSQGP